MKLLAVAVSLLLATPALACPFHDHDQNEAPKTAEKAKAPAPKADAPKQEAPKHEAPAPKTDTAKAAPAPAPAKTTGDKVSQK